MRTLAVFHLAGTTGPSKTLHPSLERLASHGSLEVVVPAPARTGPGTVADAYGAFATVTALPYGALTAPRGPIGLARLPLTLSKEVRALRRHIRASRPDLVVVATGVLPAAVLAASRENVPAIVRVAELFERGDVGGPVRSLRGRALIGFLKRHAAALVCSSNAIAAQFGAAGEVHVTTIYPGISASHAEGDGAGTRERLGLGDAFPLIAVIGNLTAARGQDLMIAAMREILRVHPHAHLLIVGAPHDRPADLHYARLLEEAAGAEPVAGHVTLAGFIADISDVYAAADIVVNPARFNEPFGRVALEALVAGCPVVATRVGAVPEVLRDGRDAVLVPPEDALALAGAVNSLAGDPSRARELAATGRQRVLQDFGVERVAEEFERLAISVRA